MMDINLEFNFGHAYVVSISYESCGGIIVTDKLSLCSNHSRNILKVDILVDFPFTRSEAKRDYY